MRRIRHSLKISSVASGRIPLVSLVQMISVAEHLNFRRAANALGVTQSSVSARIKALEENLGIYLFERHHRGVQLTKAGKQFVSEVSVGIDHIDHAIRTVGAISDGIEGTLDIGLHDSIGSGFLSELRRRFREEHPRVIQTITEVRLAETIVMVREGRLDVAFVVNVEDLSDCHSRHLWDETLMIALSQEHPLASRDTVS